MIRAIFESIGGETEIRYLPSAPPVYIIPILPPIELGVREVDASVLPIDMAIKKRVFKLVENNPPWAVFYKEQP